MEANQQIQQLQIQQNQVEGDEREYTVRRDRLKDEIGSLEAERERYKQQSIDGLQRALAVVDKIGKEGDADQKNIELSDKQAKELARTWKQVMKLLNELHALEQAPHRKR